MISLLTAAVLAKRCQLTRQKRTHLNQNSTYFITCQGSSQGQQLVHEPIHLCQGQICMFKSLQIKQKQYTYNFTVVPRQRESAYVSNNIIFAISVKLPYSIKNLQTGQTKTYEEVLQDQIVYFREQRYIPSNQILQRLVHISYNSSLLVSYALLLVGYKPWTQFYALWNLSLPSSLVFSSLFLSGGAINRPLPRVFEQQNQYLYYINNLNLIVLKLIIFVGPLALTLVLIVLDILLRGCEAESLFIFNSLMVVHRVADILHQMSLCIALLQLFSNTEEIYYPFFEVVIQLTILYDLLYFILRSLKLDKLALYQSTILALGTYPIWFYLKTYSQKGRQYGILLPIWKAFFVSLGMILFHSPISFFIILVVQKLVHIFLFFFLKLVRQKGFSACFNMLQIVELCQFSLSLAIFCVRGNSDTSDNLGLAILVLVGIAILMQILLVVFSTFNAWFINDQDVYPFEENSQLPFQIIY